MLAVISTGNELVEPGEPMLAASGPSLERLRHRERATRSMVSSASPTTISATIAGELRERLRFHLETHDVLVLSGGVSMGRFDLVPQVLEELGVRTRLP